MSLPLHHPQAARSRARVPALIPALLALAAAFGALWWQVARGGALVALDGRLNMALAAWRTRPLVVAFAWLTGAGEGVVAAALGLAASGLLWRGGRSWAVLGFWVALIGAEATTWPLKFLVARVRPAFIEGVTAASPSFPSAHATVAVAVYGFLGLVIADGLPTGPRALVLGGAALLAGLIAVSRVVLSLHYLTDVIGGGLVAAFWLLIGWRLAQGGS